MKTVKLKISGRVQGVFYRDSAREKAMQLGIQGYVKNMSDGSVEVVAQGEEEAVNAFIGWCNEGSDSAKVDNIEIKNLESSENYTEFLVAY